MGYVPVTVRAADGAGIHGQPPQSRHPDRGHRPRLLRPSGQQYNRTIVGNFIEQEMPFVQTNATLVTIFAGGNEVNMITAALGGGAGGSDPNGYIDAQVRAFGADYTTLLAGIRAARRLAAHRRAERARTRRACRISPARRSRSGRRRSAPPSA